MKYCIRWNSGFRYIKEMDEILLDNWSGEDTLKRSLDSLNIDKEKQRIIIPIPYLIDENFDLALYYIKNMIKEEGYNIAVQIPEDREDIQKCKDNEIPFMFTRFANSIDRAYTQALMGASDIYIIENLGFHIKDLQYIREQFGVQLRVFPNIAQIGGFTKEINSIQRFWIRPEDTELYEPYIDVFEFFGTSSRLSVVYEIYRDRRWMGDLNDIILDFDGESISNDSMPPYIGKQRLNCGHVCLSGHCRICIGCAEMSSVLDEAGIMVRKDKYKKPLTEEEIEELKKYLHEYRISEELDNITHA